MTEHGDELVDVDPANGTEPHRPDLEQPLPSMDGRQELEPVVSPPEPFTAPEKITSVARAVLEAPSAEPKVRMLLSLITSPPLERLLLRPMLALLPSLDEPAAWDEWLGVLAGVALELVSDGVTVDVDVARAHARELIAALFELEGEG